jgi:hypothetical protein
MLIARLNALLATGSRDSWAGWAPIQSLSVVILQRASVSRGGGPHSEWHLSDTDTVLVRTLVGKKKRAPPGRSAAIQHGTSASNVISRCDATVRAAEGN